MPLGSVIVGIVITFRPAVPGDFDDVARITRDSYLGAGYFDSAEHPYLVQIQDVKRRAQAAQIWVAEQDRGNGAQVVGAVTLARHGEPYADIAMPDELEMRILVVDPRLQRSGIGKAMVKAIIAHAQSLDGVDAVSLTTGDNWVSAHALYQSMGFSRQEWRDWTVPNTGPNTDPEVEIWLRVYRLELEESLPEFP
ncbi:GNAT family N-acetyltransferase [Renibacterium salmoninarum]|uniref:GNAT family N-acetyltransferase n=1 Tax=Renibacterium salmoninarum TaxID=1646 RepID=UPI002686C73B